MALPIFPLHLFNPESIKADVIPRVISGGEDINGEEDVIETDGGGRWESTFSGITLRTPEQERRWGAWTSHLAGGARPVRVPVYSLRTAPRPVGGNGLLRPSRLVANDDIFPTSVAFAAPYITAVVVGSVGLRATTLTVDVLQGSRVEAGMRLGHDASGRCYKIERVISRNGQQATVIVTPPTRTTISAGSPLNLDWPTVQCRAVIGQDLAPDMRFGRIGTVSISFVEDFTDAA